MLRKNSLDGFWNRCQPVAGPVSGFGPNFQIALERFQKRQKRLGEIGVWRHKGGGTKWKRNKGSYVDRDWAIIDF